MPSFKVPVFFRSVSAHQHDHKTAHSLFPVLRGSCCSSTCPAATWSHLTRRAADSRRFAPLAADAHG